jgi:hypothetical protein
MRSRKRISLVVVAIFLLFAVGTRGYAGQVSHHPPMVKEEFQKVISRLDQGGDLLVVVNVEKLLEQFMANTVEWMSVIPASESKIRDAKATLERLSCFLRDNGFYGVRAIGMSSMPMPDGLNRLRMFISRDPEATNLRLWRGLLGGRPRRLGVLDFLPTDTVVVQAANAEIGQLWELVRSGVREILPQEAAWSFDREAAKISEDLGISLDKLFDSLADEILVSVQLSRETTVRIPTPNVQLAIPEPSLLVGLAIKDETLPRMIETQLTKHEVPTVEKETAGAIIRSVSVPFHSPIPIQPTYTVHSGFLLFGSSPKVIEDAMGAFQTKTGLVSTAEFKKAFAGLSMANNGISYVSPRFSEVLARVRQHLFTAEARSRLPDGAFAQAFLNLLAAADHQSSAFVTSNLEEGVLIQGTSSKRSGEITACLILAPVGLLANFTGPTSIAFSEARQRETCLRNLGRIETAKKLWALENNKADGEEVDREALKSYLRSGDLPECPSGGIYTINPIGTLPACSIPGHRRDKREPSPGPLHPDQSLATRPPEDLKSPWTPSSPQSSPRNNELLRPSSPRYGTKPP